MKSFKKLAAFLLSLSMFSSIAACNQPTGDNTGNTGNFDSTPPASDTGNEDTGNSGGNENQGGENEGEGAAYIAAIEQQLKAANTIQITMVASSVDEEVATDMSSAYYYESTTTVTITLAKTDIGYDAKIQTVNESVYDDETSGYTETTYFIDGIAYEWDDNYQAYTYTGEIGFDLSTISGISDVLTQEEISQFKELLAQAFNETVNVTNSKVEFIYDATQEASGLVDYIGALDIEKDTLGGVLNDVLGVIDENLTVESILAEIEALDTVTVGEAVEAMDAWLTETAGVTAQQLKDGLIADERVVGLLTSMGVTEKNITAIAEMQLADEIAPYETMLLDEVVYHLINAINGSNSEENPTYQEVLAGFIEQNAGLETPAYDTVITYTTAQLKAMLPSTISALINDEQVIDNVNNVINSFKGVDLTKMKATFAVTFGNLYNISKVEAKAEMGYEKVENETVIASGDAYVSVSIDSISAQTTEIALPEGAKTVYAVWELADEHFSYAVELDTPTSEQLAEGVCGGRLIIDEYNGYAYIRYHISDEIEPVQFTVESIYMCSGDVQFNKEDLNELLNGELSYVLDMSVSGNSGMMYTDFEMPVVNVVNVQIMVVDTNGNPLSGYTVWHSSSGRGIISKRTDDAGVVYMFANADNENWMAYVSFNGTSTERVNLSAFTYDAATDTYLYTFVIQTEISDKV